MAYSPTNPGWGAAATLAKKPLPKKPKVVIRRPTATAVSTGPETRDQLEARITKMVNQNYNTQQKLVTDQAAQMRQDAEGRKLALQGAYEAAARLNSELGGKVQSGWDAAANSIQGLANTGTGSISEALQRDVATQDQALSRVGAPGTGFDALSQGGVEAYRGGTLPAEMFTRYGGIGNQFLQDYAKATNLRGIQEGAAAYGQDIAGIDKELMSQIQQLTAGRNEYELSLRKQFADQASAEQDFALQQQEANAKIAYENLKADQAQQKIDLEYRKYDRDTLTTKQKYELDKWYKQQTASISQYRAAISQQNANASTLRAQTAATKAAADIKNASKPGGGKALSPSTVSNTVARANKAGEAALAAAFAKAAKGVPGVTKPSGWDEKAKGSYVNSPEYAAAYANANRIASQQYFGTFMYRTITAIAPHLKALGWSQAKIKRAAYDIVSQKVSPPSGYKIPKAV